MVMRMHKTIELTAIILTSFRHAVPRLRFAHFSFHRSAFLLPLLLRSHWRSRKTPKKTFGVSLSPRDDKDLWIRLFAIPCLLPLLLAPLFRHLIVVRSRQPKWKNCTKLKWHWKQMDNWELGRDKKCTAEWMRRNKNALTSGRAESESLRTDGPTDGRAESWSLESFSGLLLFQFDSDSIDEITFLFAS